MEAPVPAVADEVTLTLEYPPTYSPCEFIQAFVLTGARVTVGAVGLILVPTFTVASYELEPISVPPERVFRVIATVPEVLLGSFA